MGGKEVLLSVYSESQAAASCLRPLFLPLFTAVPMATAPPSPERLELGPGVFWLRSKSFSLRLPRANGDLTAMRPRQARPDRAKPGRPGPGQARQSWECCGFGVVEASGERGEGGGTEISGWAGSGWGRAESQEHYIIAGAESEREGYESVD